VDGLTNDERRTAVTLWSITNAPLQLGDDMTVLDNFGVELLTNDEVIDVDQSGAPGSVVIEGNTPVWAQSLCDGSYYVALFNLNDTSVEVSVTWASLGFQGSATVRDLWTHMNQGASTDGFSVTLNSHSSALLRVQPNAHAARCEWPNPAIGRQ
jgi:hypothetical protein